MKNDQYQVFYCDNFCILVISPKGAIRKIYTPFRVLENQDAPSSKAKWFFVDEVHPDQKDRLLYLINGKLYPYSGFLIRISF
ncbi:MAG TPA: hypothetical protein VKR53_09630 [Puia sp.]|nr:hypothetical protein [Puia sp.]